MSATIEDPRIIEFDVRTDEMLVNMGPQHPITHGVLRLLLRTDGEIVSEVTPHIGYLHRCAEKIGENLTPRQWIPYTDRMDYLAGMNMNLGWALTVEKLMNYRVPERGRHLRVLIAEPWRAQAVLAQAAALAEMCGVSEVPGSAVVSVILGEPEVAFAAAVACLDRGVRVGCFRPPTIPAGTSRLRLTARASLSDDEIALAREVLTEVLAARP